MCHSLLGACLKGKTLIPTNGRNHVLSATGQATSRVSDGYHPYETALSALKGLAVSSRHSPALPRLKALAGSTMSSPDGPGSHMRRR